MRLRHLALMLALSASFSDAQAGSDDATLLKQARDKYDAPFDRSLKSFDCSVDFDWKRHWTETYRVGDEGTDEEIKQFVQPIHNRVAVTREDAVVSPVQTEEQDKKLGTAAMAEGLLQHAIRFSLRTWLDASNNLLLPQTGTPVHFTTNAQGYKLGFQVQDSGVEMMLSRTMALQSMGIKGSDSDRQAFAFEPGPQGLLVRAWIMGEDGNFKPGNRLIFEYSYQTVNGFELPRQVALIRESHHEVWRYALSDCKVTVNK